MRFIIAGMAAVVWAGSAVAQTTPPPDPLAVKPIPSDVQALEAEVLRAKVEQAGYTEVSDLARDTAGLWHGTAKKGDVALDIVVDKGGRIKATRR